MAEGNVAGDIPVIQPSHLELLPAFPHHARLQNATTRLDTIAERMDHMALHIYRNVLDSQAGQ